MTDILLLIIFITIIIILSVIIGLCSCGKGNSKNNSNIESFEGDTYNDIKKKTLNWCDKMQKAGLLTADQLNECIATFKDESSGYLPKEFETPQTGLPHNYSLYNVNGKKKELTANITGDNTNSIILTTNEGLTLACNTENKIYLVSNINDSNIVQKELYFTLSPQTENTYAILSPYGKYLLATDKYNADFTGLSIGSMASWNIIKINTSSDTVDNNKVLLESKHFSNFHLFYDDTIKGLKIAYGRADNMIWSLTTNLQSNNDNNNGVVSDTFLGGEYYVTKENILQQIKTYYTNKICLETAIKILRQLSVLITNNFNSIISYVNNKLNNEQQKYRLSTLDYQTRINSINQNSMITSNTKSRLISAVPLPIGMDINDDFIMSSVNKITNTKNAFLKELEQNMIKPLNLLLENLNKNSVEDDYKKYILTLNTEMQDINKRINQNNTIMNRQKDTYNKINKTYSQQLNKEKTIENTENIADANINMIDKYSAQTSYLNKIYPVIIFVLIISIIYLAYQSFLKFKENVYNKY